MICEPWDVVVVPFPFTERSQTKRRPAVVLSHPEFNQNGYTILSMITTRTHAPWPGDTTLGDFQIAGLKLPCIARLKLFSLDNRLISKKIGALSSEDQQQVHASLRRYLI
ncbi:MAG: type II toxin-antitoxin system PemK/MazF family toxin [Deltaproteobacteria bacterium]|nr:type II toxin-antitoxin system PemK/MazF family toxin [Deltaproteobacteria bacterium]